MIQEEDVIDDSKLGKTLFNTTSLSASVVNTKNDAIQNNSNENNNNNNKIEDGRFPGTVRYLGMRFCVAILNNNISMELTRINGGSGLDDGVITTC